MSFFVKNPLYKEWTIIGDHQHSLEDDLREIGLKRHFSFNYHVGNCSISVKVESGANKDGNQRTVIALKGKSENARLVEGKLYDLLERYESVNEICHLL